MSIVTFMCFTPVLLSSDLPPIYTLIPFIYAQTNDAYGQIETTNVKTGEIEIIGSCNERFSYTDEDIDAYLPDLYRKNRTYLQAKAPGSGARDSKNG